MIDKEQIGSTLESIKTIADQLEEYSGMQPESIEELIELGTELGYLLADLQQAQSEIEDVVTEAEDEAEDEDA